MSNLTVYCAARGSAWLRRAERALDSVHAYAPDVELMLYEYKKGERFSGLAQIETRWVLFLDADVLATGDVRAPIRAPDADEADVHIRRSPLHEHPRWTERHYAQMIDAAGLAYHPVVWNGAFYASKWTAHLIAQRFGYWRGWYRRYKPKPFGGYHKKPDQHALTLALIEMGALVKWIGPDLVSWQGHNEGVGLIHHFSGVIYAVLERQGKLREALHAEAKLLT